MIELLNKYRAARADSEQAARELGYAFGAAFEEEHRNIDEFQNPTYDDLTLHGEPRLNPLGQLFIGQVFERAMSGWIRPNADGTFSVGVSLNNAVLSRIEGSQVVLVERPFVLGFIDGFRASRRSNAPQRNGTPALAN